MFGKDNLPVLSGLIGENSRCEGTILFRGSLRIDGIVTGKLICSDNELSAIIITETAQVEADIIADIVIVSGYLYGSVYGLRQVQLNMKGRLEGRVFTDNLIIEQGAHFQGQCISTRDLEASKREEIKSVSRKNPSQLPLPGIPEKIIKPTIVPPENS